MTNNGDIDYEYNDSDMSDDENSGEFFIAKKNTGGPKKKMRFHRPIFRFQKHLVVKKVKKSTKDKVVGSGNDDNNILDNELTGRSVISKTADQVLSMDKLSFNSLSGSLSNEMASSTGLMEPQGSLSSSFAISQSGKIP